MKKLLLSAFTLVALNSADAQNFITKTCYRGAFAPAPATMWSDTWAEWDPQNKTYPAPTMTITGNINANATWSTGQTILLSAQCYVTGNSVLTIQPGVTILGDKSVVGAGLFITKGSQLIANGTKAAPIVFTSNQAAGQRSKGDWGGIILLGKATNNTPGGINNIEGLPISTNTEYGVASGADDNDNSGSLQYVRIEFSGYAYQQDKEINGITFGAVGRGTTVDYLQVSYCNDDAFEWFGGTVNCKHLISYRNVDDDFDTDFGFSGSVQFCLAVRDPQLADAPAVSTSEFFESDNNATGTSATPLTSAIFSNVTAIGPLRGVMTSTYAAGHRSRARIRRNSALKIYNSILMDQATRGVFIDGSASETNASTGALKFKNNILAGYGQRATESGTFGIINSNTFVIANANDTLKSSANILTTPYNYLAPDYRPAVGSIALAGASFTDAVLSAVTGTMNSTVMATVPASFCIGQASTINQPAIFTANSTLTPEYCSFSWNVTPGVTISNSMVTNPSFTISTVGTHSITLTVTDANGTSNVTNAVTTYTCLDVSVKELNKNGVSIQIFPNPAKDVVNLTINSSKAAAVSVSIYDITGKLVMSPVNKTALQTGEHRMTVDTSDLQNGIYFLSISTAGGIETVKLIINK